MNSELQPTFEVKAFLDGDDDAAIQTGNFAGALERAVAKIREDGFCVSYSILKTDPYELRRIVGRWLRVRAEHPGQGIAGSVYPGVTHSSLFMQLAADAEHSDLLIRLFAGEEPLPYDEWLAR